MRKNGRFHERAQNSRHSKWSKFRGGVFYGLFGVIAALAVTTGPAFAHGDSIQADPELLTGWLTWVHLLLQWVHLVAFALWLGLTAGVLLLDVRLSLNALLHSFWILLLVLLATGSYNMEYSAGISETPSLLMLPVLEDIPYGISYTVVLAVKVVLYSAAVSLSLVTTLLYLRRKTDEKKLRRFFLASNSVLGVLLAFLTAVVLFYHEVADLWPTAIHSLGGVLGPEGATGQVQVELNAAVPNDFALLTTHAVWADIIVRWLHLLGFGLLIGGMAVGCFVGRDVSPKRFLWFSWTLLLILLLSGVGNMERWAPFTASPYIWNLPILSHIRFGRTYTLLMTLKHALAIALVGLVLVATWRYLRNKRQERSFSSRPYMIAGTILGLVIAYLMVTILLVHEGVDHAL